MFSIFRNLGAVFFFFSFDQTELTFCNFLDDDGCEKRLSQVFMVFEFLAENFSQFALSHLFGVSRAENLKPWKITQLKIVHKKINPRIRIRCCSCEFLKHFSVIFQLHNNITIDDDDCTLRYTKFLYFLTLIIFWISSWLKFLQKEEKKFNENFKIFAGILMWYEFPKKSLSHKRLKTVLYRKIAR